MWFAHALGAPVTSTSNYRVFGAASFRSLYLASHLSLTQDFERFLDIVLLSRESECIVCVCCPDPQARSADIPIS